MTAAREGTPPRYRSVSAVIVGVAILGIACGLLLEAMPTAPSGARGSPPTAVPSASRSRRPAVAASVRRQVPSGAKVSDDSLHERAPRTLEPSPYRGLGPSGPLVPPDPVEPGDAWLFLALVDAADGRPVECQIHLWRLDAPANGNWLEGDQLLLQADVPVEGRWIRGLPAGRYRAVCLAERADADDPDAFEVAPPVTHRTLVLRMPRDVPARLLLFDDRGARVVEAERGPDRGSRGLRHVYTRPWVKMRRPRDPGAIFASGGIGGRFFGSHARGGWRTVRDSGAGFDLGPTPVDPRNRTVRKTAPFRAPGTGTCYATVRGSDPEERIYVGLLMPVRRVLEQIVLEDGGDPRDIRDDVYVSTQAVRVEGGAQATAWSSVPIEVRIQSEDYEEATFRFTLGEGIPVMRLKPRSATEQSG